MNKFKRLMALFLAVCMVVGLVPVQASAAELGTKPADGTVQNEPFDVKVSTNHRIPGLVALNGGTLIATADARWTNEADGGGMDVVVSTSTDSGKTWNYTYAAYLGDNGNEQNNASSTLMDPLIITDGTNLYLLADLFPAGYSTNAGNFTETGSGFTGKGKLIVGKEGQYNCYLDGNTIYDASGNPVKEGYKVDGWFNLYDGENYVSNLFFADSPYKVYPTSYISMQTYTNGQWSAPELLNVKPAGYGYTILGPGSGLVTSDGDIAFTTYSGTGSAGSNMISLVYGKDGIWNTVNTSAATNESSIIELSDGTIRTFVKRGRSNTIAYVDFTKTDSGYTAGSLVDTGVKNFSNCMVSSLKYSKTIDGKEVVLVCCPSKHEGGEWAGRFNGKIYAFTLNNDKTMKLEGSYQINNSFFAYSNMAELPDGTIGLLYEDECISYKAGNYYGNKSHITYTNVDLKKELNLTFDGELVKKDVELKVGDVWKATLEKAVDAGTHTSDAADVAWQSNTVTKKVPKAKIGTTSAFDGGTINLADCLYTFTQQEDGKWVISADANGTTVYVDAYHNDSGHPSRAAVDVDGRASVDITASGFSGKTDGPFIFAGTNGSGTVGSLHFYTDSSADKIHRWDQCSGSGHPANNSSGTHGLFVLTINEDGTLTEVTSLDGIKSNSQYLIAGKGDDGIYYAMHPTMGTDNYYAHVAKVGEIAEETETVAEITVTAKAAGTTSVIIGTTQYNITVVKEKVVEKIEIAVGEHKTVRIDGANYSEKDVKTQPNAAIASIDKIEAKEIVKDVTVGNAVESISEGKYVIYTYLDAYVTNIADGNRIDLSTTEQTVWNVAVADRAAGTYYITDSEGKYLYVGNGTAGVTNTQTAVKLVYGTSTDGPGKSGFFIQDANGSCNLNNSGATDNAYGKSGANGSWSRWQFKPYSKTVEKYTEVTFVGISKGPTTAVIGNVQYDITVKENPKQKVTLYVGERKTFFDETGSYSEGTIEDETVAEMGIFAGVEIDRKLSEKVSEIESGETYLLVNTRADKVLTDTANNGGLQLASKDSIENEKDYWIITKNGEKYTVESTGTNAGYLVVGYGSASVGSQKTQLTLDYDSNGYWYVRNEDSSQSLNHYGGGSSTKAAGYGDKEDVGSRWYIYKLETTVATKITFTGLLKGNTTAKVGNTTYEIEVLERITGDVADFNNIVGVEFYSDDNSNPDNRSDLNMAGKVIKKLTISENASFHLGVDITDADSVMWSTDNDAIATVDENGNVTGVKEGTANVTATVFKNGVAESISIPVKVEPSLVGIGQTKTSVLYYVEKIKNTTPYYTVYLSTHSTTEPLYEMKTVTEGEVIFLERPAESVLGWIWTSTPKDKHALAFMASTGSSEEYYPLKAEDGTLGTTSEYYKGSTAYKNITTHCGSRINIDEVLTAAISDAYKCDGAMSNMRRSTAGVNGESVPKFVSSMTFISEPLPEITKTVDGVLPVTRLYDYYRRYKENMVAAVAETVFFKIEIKFDVPQSWANAEETQSAIVYDTVILTDDKLGPNSYFYDKELDNLDGKWDGYIPAKNRTRTLNITEKVNAPWTEAEKENGRTLTYYLYYEIQPEDIPRFRIENIANLEYGYSSTYSKGKFAGDASADASITVVGEAMDKVVIDFGQTVTLEGVSSDYVGGIYTENDSNDLRKYTASYGEVVTRKESDGTYTIIYTPTEIMQSQDQVVLYGKVNDSELGEVEKAINGFAIYPATTMYYEEGFMFNENSKDWDTSNAEKATKNQEMEYFGKSQFDETGMLVGYESDKEHNYGYDPMYNSTDTIPETGYSAGSYATTTKMGAKTEFEITGTGFEIYADCMSGDEETGYVGVQVKDAEGKTVKFFMINTASVAGTGAATVNQAGTAYGAPIVSLNNLKYGKYTIAVSKIMEEKPVYLDGLRVYNTVEDSTVYSVDNEGMPQFVEMRDMVLTSVIADIEGLEDYNSQYADEAGKILTQVYAGTQALAGAVVLANDGAYTTEDMADMLDNGPKNELYLYPDQAITFTLNEGLTAQIGMHVPMGAASYSLDAGTTNKTVTSSTNMFYESVNGPVTITNTGDNVLSLTTLKVTAGQGVMQIFDEIGEKNIEAAMLSLSRIDAGVYDEVQSEPQDATKVFSDVIVDWYTENVQYVFNKNIMTGIGGTDLFAPNDSITKAQVAQILYNLEGKPYVYSEAVFDELNDVYDTEWYADAVAWAYAAGVVTGDLNTKEFNPNTDITREQLSVMLYRYAQHKHYNTAKAKGFNGLDNAEAVSNWAADGMKWAVGNGIITGVDKDGVRDLAPQGDATRAQVATMVQRFCNGNNI